MFCNDRITCVIGKEKKSIENANLPDSYAGFNKVHCYFSVCFFVLSAGFVSCKNKSSIFSKNKPQTCDESLSDSDCGGANKEVSGAVKLRSADCLDPDLTKLKKGTKLTLCDGTEAVGKMAVLSSDRIKAGSTIVGVSGTFTLQIPPPDCSEAGEQDCISNGNYVAFDTNIIDAYDIRIGKSIAGIQGKLKVNCRNAIKSASFNYDGSLSVIGQGSQLGGTSFDWWDTWNDYSGFHTDVPNGWEDNFCNPADDWQDVSIDGGSGGDNLCNEAADDCQFKDRITGLIWSETQPTGNWSTSILHCGDTMNTTGGSGGGPFAGQTDWRLATQKEMQTGFIHGIKGTQDTNFIANVSDYYWSATTATGDGTKAWYVDLSDGTTTSSAPKTSTYKLVCVRGG